MKGKEIRTINLAKFLCLFFLLFVIGCKQENRSTIQPMEEKAVVTEYMEKKMSDLPYFGLLKNGHFILPTRGSTTQVEVSSYQKAIAICDDSGFEFWVKGNRENYLYEVKLYQVKDSMVIWEQSYFDLSFLPVDLQEGELYLLRLELSSGANKAYYDFPFFYQEKSDFGIELENILKEINDHRREEEKVMGEVAITIKEARADGSIKGLAKMVVAIRKEGGFEYLDKFYHFNVSADKQKEIEEIIKNKKRGTYDKVQKSIVLADNGEWYEDMGRFVQMEETEVYAGDAQKIYTLYRRDEINDDYLIDELSDIHFRGIGWKDNKFYFLGYGIFGDDVPQVSSYRGIAFFEWDGKKLHIPCFVEIKEAEIEEYLNKHLVIQNEKAKVFWLQQGTYFVLDLDIRKLYKSEVPLSSKFDEGQAIFYWQAQEDKRNQAVLWNRIKEENIRTLYFEDRNQRIAGVGMKYLYVGEYQVSETLEYLNRETVYPLNKIVLYYSNGRIYKTITPPSGKFFGMPIFIEKDFGVLPILEKKYGHSTHRGEVKVDYMEIGEQSFDFREVKAIKNEQKPSMMKEFLDKSQDFYGTNLRMVGAIAGRASYGSDQTVLLDWDRKVESGQYSVRMDGQLILAETLQKALLSAKGLEEYQIYYTKGKEENLLYDSKWKKSDIMIPAFATVKQFPELPRGCEVTALSMLLHYHNSHLPDRFALADELTIYSRQITNGEISNRIDMKEAFSGSMFNTKEPGLGVYIEPISLIARRYLGSRVQNVTGINLTQLLTFVSNSHPVQIITSDMAAAVPDSLKTTWHTDNGYMEITYREHSVVVVGFDTSFVYFADPLTGRIEKSSIKNFEAGFEAFGRQALVITK